MRTNDWSDRYPHRRVYLLTRNGTPKIHGLVRYGRRRKDEPVVWSAHIIPQTGRYISMKGLPSKEAAMGWCDLNWASL